VVVPLVSLVIVAAFLVGIPSAYAASQVSLSGTGAPVTGDAPASGTGVASQDEFANGPVDGQSPGAYPGVITDRAISSGTGHGVSVSGSAKAKSTPQFNTGFEGLNLYQQRYARGGNQFTVEPPDQGLCVGNGYELEAVNDVLNVYDTSGHSTLPDNTAPNIVSGFPRDVNHAVDLNSFYGYAPAINRATGVTAQEITDPTCIYDAATQRVLPRGPDPRPERERVAQPREPPRPRGQPDVEPERQLEHLQGRRHQRRIEPEHGERLSVPRRLPAHRGRRERHLSDHELLPVERQRFRRSANLRPV